MKTYTPTKTVEKKSDISYILSQKEATQNAIRLLHYIYSNPMPEAISVDNQSYDLKYIAKLSNHNHNKNKIQPHYLSDKSLYPYLHPNSIEYYIYTLGKIVI